MPLHFPGYNFVGPGSNVFGGKNPVNSADLIALLHDLDYELALNKQDIVSADRTAIRRFVDDYREHGYWADLAGIFGLGIKYNVERIIGVQYPVMGKRGKNVNKNFGQYLYAIREKAHALAWRDAVATKSFKGTYKQWKSNLNPAYAQTKFDYSIAGPNYHKIRADFAKANNIPDATTLIPHIPTEAEVTHAITTTEAGYEAIRELYPELEQITQEPQAGPSGVANKRPAEEAVDSAEAPQQKRPNTEAQSPVKGSMAPTNQDPAIPDQSGSGRGPSTDARAGASGSSGLAAAGASNSNTGLTWIGNSHGYEECHLSVSKERIFVSYGYSHETLSTEANYNITSTPLALIPVDFIPFYLTPIEWKQLPAGSRVVHVSCSVTPLGTRTAFDHGTTVSGVATSEYVALGQVITGVNSSFYGHNASYDVSATDPMKPTGTKTISRQLMKDRFYDKNIHGMPAAIKEYWVYKQNKGSAPPGRGGKYMTHTMGNPRVDEKIKTFLINQAIGTPIAHYTYTPKNGYINPGKRHQVPYHLADAKVHVGSGRPQRAILNWWKNSNNDTLPGITGFDETPNYMKMVNSQDHEYMSLLDHYDGWTMGDGSASTHVQPQLHVGLLATPQLNPANADRTYLNSACYWKVECSITIQFNLSSAYAEGDYIYSWPREARFMKDGTTKQYTDGVQLFGRWTSLSHAVDSGEKTSSDEPDGQPRTIAQSRKEVEKEYRGGGGKKARVHIDL